MKFKTAAAVTALQPKNSNFLNITIVKSPLDLAKCTTMQAQYRLVSVRTIC